MSDTNPNPEDNSAAGKFFAQMYVLLERDELRGKVAKLEEALAKTESCLREDRTARRESEPWVRLGKAFFARAQALGDHCLTCPLASLATINQRTSVAHSTAPTTASHAFMPKNQKGGAMVDDAPWGMGFGGQQG
jgi:hypothetical protein